MSQDFSVILQSPLVRQLVQDGILVRAFHDALFPAMLFRGDVESKKWPGNVGDRIFETARGLLTPDLAPLTPGDDPIPETLSYEQWTAVVQQWATTVDTHMLTDNMALASLLLSNLHAMGMKMAQNLNRLVRDREYNAALSGNTVCDQSTGPAHTIHVRSLNGFTAARNPSLAGASPAQFAPVSTANPLPITITHGATPITRNVTAFAPDNAGDEIGPGTLTLDGANVTVTARDPVISGDASFITRVGGGQSIDPITSADIFSFASIRGAVQRFRQQNVPRFQDGRYHCHIDPTSEGQVFSDPEMQRLNTALPDWYMYKDFALGHILNVIFLPNTECPQIDNVLTTNGDGVTYSPHDPFAGELFSGGTQTPGPGAGVPIHRPLFVGQGGIREYWIDYDGTVTDAGITGKIGQAKVVNNGIDVDTDHIAVLLRGPLNRMQDKVTGLAKFAGDWSIRTDGASGDGARYKRFLAVEHGA